MTDREEFVGRQGLKGFNDFYDKKDYVVRVSSSGNYVVIVTDDKAEFKSMIFEPHEVDELVTALLYFKQKVVDNENRAAQG